MNLATPIDQSGPQDASSNRTRVLVIDDDRKLCRLIKDYLEPMGYEISAVHNGPEGVEKAVSEPWHAVILDVMLPGLNGFEVLKQIKTREQLLDEIRDRNYEVFDRSIDVHASALRKKLGDDPKTPRFIRTVRAVGYMLINPAAE